MTYMGDLNFDVNTTSRSIEVTGHIKKNTTISAAYTIVNVNDVTITVTVDGNATGYVLVTGTATTVYVPVVDGVATISSSFPAGTYSAVVQYLGDDNYNSNSTTVSFTIANASRLNTTISTVVTSVDNNVNIVTTLNESATGLVKFVISGAEDHVVYVDVDGGQATYDIVLPAGTYYISALYLGDNAFNGNSTDDSFTVTDHIKQDTAISAQATVNGNIVTIDVAVNENATGFISLEANGAVVYMAVENGAAQLSSRFAPGSYSGTVKYLGDSNFNENSTTLEFVVTQGSSNTTDTFIAIDTAVINNNVTISVSVNESATGIVILDINGEMVSLNVSAGSAVYNTILKPDTYSIAAFYMGDDVFNGNYTSTELTVNKLNASLSADPVSTVYNGDKYLVATLKDSANNTLAGYKVSVVLNGKTYSLTTDANGQVRVSTNSLAPKTYAASITFAGDDEYASASVNANVVVTKAKPVLTAKAKKTYKVKTKTKKYAVTLKTNKNAVMKKVKLTLKVNGKTYKATTNKRGKATFKITKLTKKGTFKAVIKYKGNSYYTALSKTVKIKTK